MRSTLISCLHDGYSGSFVSLLENFGSWSRHGAGIAGLARTGTHSSYSISDDDALMIDSAMSELRSLHPRKYKVLRWYYIDGCSLSQLKDRFAHEVLKSGDHELIEMIRRAAKAVYLDAVNKSELALFELLSKRYLNMKGGSNALH